MASNRLPDGQDSLLFLAGKALAGAQALGGEIPLLINTAPLIKGERKAFLQAQVQFSTACGALPGLHKTLKAARAEAQGFCTKARDWLKNFLGQHAGQQWCATGWSARSIAIPERDADLEHILESLEGYFRDHPEQECAQLNVTSARAGELYGALTAADQGISSGKADIEAKRQARDAAVTALRARLRGLRGELQQRLGAADPRWVEFGFNVPAQPTMPAVPEDVVVNARAPGKLFIHCAASAHASRYRLFVQRRGIDAEPVFVRRSREPMFELGDLKPGQAYEIFLTAANDGAESRFSKPVAAVVAAEGEAVA